MKQLLSIIFLLNGFSFVVQKTTQINLIKQYENSCTYEITLADLDEKEIFVYDNFSEVIVSINKGVHLYAYI